MKKLFYLFVGFALCIESAATFAPDGVPFTVAEKPWVANGLGNHRAVVRIPNGAVVRIPNDAGSRPARAILKWRRTDPQPEIKHILVASVPTGKFVPHVFAVSVTAETGIIDFEPIPGVTEYYIYYLPYRERTGSHEGRGQPNWNDYFKPNYSSSSVWHKSLPQGPVPTKQTGTDPTKSMGTDPTKTAQPMGTDPTKTAQTMGTDPTKPMGTDPTKAGKTMGTDPTKTAQTMGTDPKLMGSVPIGGDKNGMVQCEILRYESRTVFEAWTPMGLRATTEETARIRQAHPENPVVFVEDRTNPIHPATWLPAKWGQSLNVVGSVPMVTGSVPTVAGTVPSVTGSVPTVTGSVPTATGSVPTVTGSVPTVAGSVPSVKGSVPTATGSVPRGMGTDPEGKVRFVGEALRDEYYVWQVAVWTPGGAVKAVEIAFNDLIGPENNRLKGGTITCFNTDGVRFDGSTFHQAVAVPANRLQPLWCGLMIPRDAVPGVYRGQAILTADGQKRIIDLEITVKSEIVRDHGDSELWRMSRLRWLNSRIGEGDEPVQPYRAMTCDQQARRITASEKTVTLDLFGLPTSIAVNGHEVLRAPMRFVVETQHGDVKFSLNDLSLDWTSEQKLEKARGLVSWRAKAKREGLTVTLTGRMEFDGFLRYTIEVVPEAACVVKDVRLETDYSDEACAYFMGCGYRGRDGGVRPKQYTWNWQGPYDSYWTGGVNAGLHVEFRGGSYHGPLVADRSYHATPAPTWANGGRGRVLIDGPRVVARSGAIDLPKTGRTWSFDLQITPVKPLNEELQFSQRYYHAAPAGFEQGAALGANIANIHHAQTLNPVINYPFVVQEPLKEFIRAHHAKGRKVKLYYTIRELSNHVAELQALRSLGSEIISPGNGHGAPWLWEHMGEGYRPAWYVRLNTPGAASDGLVDAAFVLSPHSRWINYYLEGLRWMFENYEIDGIYMDDVAFDRTVMKRMRRIIERYRPGALVDLHSNTGYSRGPMNQYTDFFPYIDRLWFGESFRYNDLTPDAWFVTFSGIPFGLMSEMLQGGGNPWLGTVYGATRRLNGVTGTNPSAIWQAWQTFGIEDAKMAGYWEAKPAVATDADDVKATAFIRADRTLVALGNFASAPRTVKLTIDWKRLNLDLAKVVLEAPEIPEFQSARTFTPTDPIPVAPKRGWLLVLRSSR